MTKTPTWISVSHSSLLKGVVVVLEPDLNSDSGGKWNDVNTGARVAHGTHGKHGTGDAGVRQISSRRQPVALFSQPEYMCGASGSHSGGLPQQRFG